jgi:hypothetical protein
VCKESLAGATDRQKALLAAMKSPAVLYTVTLVKRGETVGTTVGSFAIVATHFTLVGKMTKAGGADKAPPSPSPSPADVASPSRSVATGASASPAPRRGGRSSRSR